MGRGNRLLGPMVIYAVLLCTAFAVVVGAHTTVSQETVEELGRLNRLLDQLIQVLQSPDLQLSGLPAKLDEAHPAFDELLESFPDVNAMSFLDLFNSLFSIGTSLDDASRQTEQGEAGLWANFGYYLAADNGPPREEPAGIGVDRRTAQAAAVVHRRDGRALVTAYPRFDCHAFL
jgi:hypothetical protein